MPSTTSWPDSGPPEPAAAGGPTLSPLDLAHRLGHEFADPGLLATAIAHRSWCGERIGVESNERLEFLGDAVLGVAVAEHCYHRFPHLAEGRLAKIRSAVVNTTALAEVAMDLELGPALLLGKGEESTGGRTKPSILADALEALIGAVHLDAGWAASRPLVVRMLEERIETAARAPDEFDHKSRLQELAVQIGAGVPRYVLEGSGPDHRRRYVAQVFVGGARRGSGSGSSKKAAEQQAAAEAYQELGGA